MTKTHSEGPAYHRRKAERPAEILEAGLEEFFQHGFAKANLNRIAQRAGVSRATLYLYFDGKDALFEAVANAAMGPLIDEVAATSKAMTGCTRDLLRHTLGRMYEMMVSTKNSALMRILIAEGKSHPDLVRRYHAQVSSRGQAALAALIQRGIDRGELRPGAATSFPQVVVAPVFFYMLNSMIFDEIEPLDADAFLEAHVDLILNGIAADPAEGEAVN